MVDDDARHSLEELRMSPAHLADPIERAAVRDDDEVVVGRRVRIAPDALDTGEEVVQGRRRVGRDRVGRRPRAPRRAGRSRGSPRACRRPGSRGRRPARAGRRGRARRRCRERRRGTASGRRSSAGPGLRRARASGAACSSAGAAAARRPAAARREGRPRAAAARPASAATSTPFASSSGISPASRSWRRLEHAGAALGGVVELDVEVRDPPQPQARPELVADERHRPAERLDGRRPLGRLADDADPDLGVPQVRRRLDARDRHEPDPRIRDIPSHDRRDLLPQELVDPFGALAHRTTLDASCAVRRGASPRQPETARLTVCDGEALDDVAFFEVVEAGEADAALVVGERPRGRRRGSAAATRSCRSR